MSKYTRHFVCISALAGLLSANQGLANSEVGSLVEPDINKDYTYNYQAINRVEPDVKTLTTDLFGDAIDPASGSIRFRQTDVSLPGNFALPVEITRTLSDPSSWHRETLEFSNWSIELPHVRSTYVTLKNGTVEGAYWADGEACTQPLNSNPRFTRGRGSQSFYLDPADYWTGDVVSIPGKGTATLLTASPGDANYDANDPYKRFNNQQWEVSCINTADTDAYEGFEVTTGDGVTYTFAQQKVIVDQQLVSMAPVVDPHQCDKDSNGCMDSLSEAGSSDETRLQKRYIFMLATKVTDKFGNEVVYDYHDDGRLKSITASDDRTITITYNGVRVDKVTANGRVWEYSYSDHGLKQVNLPNDQKWVFDNGENQVYNYGFWREIYPPQDRYGEECYALLNTDLTKYITITHPYGMKGEFTLKARCVGQTEVPEIKQYNPHRLEERQTHWIKRENRNLVIDKKVLTFSDNTKYTWQYAYSDNKGGFIGETTEDNRMQSITFDGIARTDLNRTTVTHPDLSTTSYYASRVYGPTQGNVIAQEDRDASGNLLRRVNYTYDQSSAYGNNQTRLHVFGPADSPHDGSSLKTSYKDEKLTRKTSQTIELHYGADKDVDSYSQNVLAFDTYNQIAQVQEASPTDSRFLWFDYLAKTAKGVFNLPTTVKVHDTNVEGSATVASQITYKDLSFTGADGTASAVKVTDKTYQFSQEKQRVASYHTSGKVTGLPKKVEYNVARSVGSGKRYVQYDTYRRGQPTQVTVPGRNTTGVQRQYQSVDENGWVQSQTDFNGNITSFSYDAVGRIESIDGPGNFLDTAFTWIQTANSIKRQEQRCTLGNDNQCTNGTTKYSQTLEFDNLLRPTLIHKTANGENRYQVKEYDYKNQETFASYWMDDASCASSDSTTSCVGTTREFDAIGRPKTERQFGGGTVTTAYLDGNRMRVTDAENNETTTTYQAFGTPSYTQPTLIDSPENVETLFDVDELGLVHKITQSGLNKSHIEYRAYDANKHLCKVKRGDVGQTVYSRNALGQVRTMVQGTVGGTDTNCEYTNIPSGVVTYTYDNLGDSDKITYADGETPTVSYSHDKNGNLLTLSAGDVDHVYTYNELNLLETETLTVAGKRLARSGTAVSLDYEYDTLGAVSALTYPDGDRVTFSPNGFGEPTQAIRQANSGLGRTQQVYAQSATYYATGSINTFAYGNAVTHKTTLNDRQVPRNIKDASTTQTMLEYDYLYDNNLNVTRLQDVANSSYHLNSLTYDGLDRLKSTTANSDMGASAIAYDTLGNITSYSSKGRNFEYHYNDTLNRLDRVTYKDTGVEYKAFVYDDRGNVESDGFTAYLYNRANQMVKAGGDKTFVYDGHNRRVKKSTPDGTEYSLYSQDGTLLYRETDDGSINYVYLGKKLVAKDGVVKSNSGTQHYRPYGESIEGPKDDVGYTGHKFDKDLDLSYMQARYYDPVIGRFYSNDPVDALSHLSNAEGIKGFNRYSYVVNNPYKYTDPDGRTITGTYNVMPAIKKITGGKPQKGDLTRTVGVLGATAGAVGCSMTPCGPVALTVIALTMVDSLTGQSTISEAIKATETVDDSTADAVGAVVDIAVGAKGKIDGVVTLGKSLVKDSAGMLVSKTAKTTVEVVVTESQTNEKIEKVKKGFDNQ